MQTKWEKRKCIVDDFIAVNGHRDSQENWLSCSGVVIELLAVDFLRREWCEGEVVGADDRLQSTFNLVFHGHRILSSRERELYNLFPIIHISCIGLDREVYRRLISFIMIGDSVELFGIAIGRCDEESGSHRIERPCMTDLYFRWFDALCFVFVRESISEWLTEMFLDCRDGIMGRDAGWFIDEEEHR